jgi:hypothetical protein
VKSLDVREWRENPMYQYEVLAQLTSLSDEAV